MDSEPSPAAHPIASEEPPLDAGRSVRPRASEGADVLCLGLDIFLRVLEHLPVKRRAQGCAVSRAWCKAVDTPSLWHELDLTYFFNGAINDAVLLGAAKKAAGNLFELALFGQKEIAYGTVVSVLEANSASLLGLTMSDLSDDDAPRQSDVPALITLINAAPNLVYLEVNIRCELAEAESIVRRQGIYKVVDLIDLEIAPRRLDSPPLSMDAVTALIGQLAAHRGPPHACTLSLNLASSDYGLAGASKLARSLDGDVVLSFLCLSNNNIGLDGARELAESIHHHATLSALAVDGNGIGDEGASHFARCLTTTPALEALYLNRNNIGSLGSAHLADGLLPNHSLLLLNLSNNSIGDSGATCLAASLCVNTTLTKLYLDNNAIGAPGAAKLAEMLRANRSIDLLSLKGNNVRNAGAIAFADSLRGNTALTSLILCINNIHSAGATELAASLHHNATLTSLDLSFNYIRNPAANLLAASLQSNTTLTRLDLTWNSIGVMTRPELVAQSAGRLVITEMDE